MMRVCAGFIQSPHTLFSERDTKRDGQSTIVHVESAEITTDEHLIRFRITASHILWKMVRRLIGSLVEVGRGRASVEDFARLIENTRSQARN
jgi:tRNA pseudouridine38-40 synthase